MFRRESSEDGSTADEKTVPASMRNRVDSRLPLMST